MTAHLPAKDLLIVGFWTDWGYLNNVLANAIAPQAGMTASRTSGTRRHGVHHQRKLWVWLSGLEFDKMGEANAHL
jgi:hypothetical protein